MLRYRRRPQAAAAAVRSDQLSYPAKMCSPSLLVPPIVLPARTSLGEPRAGIEPATPALPWLCSTY